MKEKNDIQARFAADAGIQTASALISDDVQNGEIDEIPEELDSPSDSPLAPWNYQVSITPGPGNSVGSLLSYTLRSTGTDGIFSKKIVSMIEQESFGEYLIFTNSETTPDGQQNWYVAGITIEDGPIFTNGPLNIYIPQGYYQNQACCSSNGTPITASPFFLSTVTSAASPSPQYPDAVHYGANTLGGQPPYDSSGNPIPGDYEDIYKGGRPDLITGAKPIPFPTGYSSIQNASWGNSSGFPAAPGVYVNTGKPQPPEAGKNPKPAAGIYVSGSVGQILMGSSPNTNNSMMTLTQGTSQYQITYVTSNPVTIPPGSIVNGKPIHTPQEIMTGNTILQNANSYSVYQGTTNGTIFVNGNIGSSSGGGISGTVQGKYTIAASGNLYINGNIDYQDTTPGQPPTNSQDMLGLIGTNVIIGDSAPPNLMIYADIYAGAKQSDGSLNGYFYAQNYDTRQTGTLQLFGGVVSVYHPLIGTFTVDPYSGETQITSGYANNKHYDPRLAQSPPPFFPTTGKFRTIYWHEE